MADKPPAEPGADMVCDVAARLESAATPGSAGGYLAWRLWRKDRERPLVWSALIAKVAPPLSRKRLAEPALFHEGGAGGGFVGLDVEKLVELGDLEDLPDFRVDRAELHLDLELGGFFVHL